IQLSYGHMQRILYLRQAVLSRGMSALSMHCSVNHVKHITLWREKHKERCGQWLLAFSSALHTAGGVSMHQSQYLSFADKIEIVFNGLLEAARRHGELDGILCRQ